MQRFHYHRALAASASCRLLRQSMLLVALAAAGAAVAQPAQPADTADAADKGGKYPSYRVINLAAGLLASNPTINAKGQVAFSIGGDGTVGYFYDGTAVRNIGTLGGNEVVAVDLNDLGQVTGRASNASGGDHAFLWSAGGGMFDIGVAAGVGYSVAAAINNRGVVTGSFQYGAVHAFRWSVESGLEDLGAFVPGFSGNSFGNALNDAGLITGMATTADDNRHAFIWTRSGGLVDIDTLNSADALPAVVGARGEVAGNRLASLLDSSYRAFLWTPAAGMVDIGNGGGVAALMLAMTPDLHMTGFVDVADGSERAMSWTRSAGTRTLGTLGGQSSRGIGVNGKGHIVGFSQNRAGDWRAFVWSARRGMLDLNRYLRHAPPGLVLEAALAINDDGAIVATSNAGVVLLRPDRKCGCGHALGPLVAPAVVKAGVALQASVAFVDEDRVGTRGVTWSWGDGSAAQAGQLREGDGAGEATASHGFAEPGIYTVRATVVDSGGRGIAVSHDVVVTASAGGALAGAGTVMSPAGAYARAPLYAGKASFRLLAPTVADAPAGRVPSQLRFLLPGLDFRSQDLRQLERDGARQVFEGSGTVGGAGGYKFALSTSAAAPAGGQGVFYLRIWHTDPASRKDVVDYDNAGVRSGSAAGRVTDGSIVVD